MRRFNWRSGGANAGRCLLGAVLAIAALSCKRDPGARATPAECQQACAHLASLNKGDKDTLTSECDGLCAVRDWTVGDVTCLGDAATYDDAKRCAAAANVALDDAKKQERARLEAQIKARQARIEALLAELATAPDEAQRAALIKKIDAEQHDLQTLRGEPVGTGRPSSAPRPCKCDPNDPLCSCL